MCEVLLYHSQHGTTYERSLLLCPDRYDVLVVIFVKSKMATMHTSLAQQHSSRSLLRQPTASRTGCCKQIKLCPSQTLRAPHISLRSWHTGSSSAAAAAASAATAAFRAEPEGLINHPLQRLCKNVLVGVAAAAAWSVAASAFGGSSSVLASLTIATQPGASGMFIIYA